jgi:peptidyl-prolyl cis-trans isomerase C
LKEFFMRLFSRVLVALGLAISCCVLAQDDTTDSVGGDPVVLRVNDEEMVLSEFNERFTFYANNLAAEQGMQMTPEMAPLFDSLKPQYLDQLATEKVIQQQGTQRGLIVDESVVENQITQIKANFESEEQYKEALAGAGLSSEELLRTLLREAELSRQTIDALRGSIQVKPYQLQLYYDLHKAEYATPGEACAKHILVESAEDAKTVQADLASGISFEDEAKAKSIDPGSGSNGGDLGCFPAGAMIPVFEEAAFNAPLNKVTEPIQSEFGFHLILPYERKEAVTPTLEEVTDQVTEGAQNEVLKQLLEGYQERATVETFPELVAPAEEAVEEAAPGADDEMKDTSEETTEETTPSEGQ